MKHFLLIALLGIFLPVNTFALVSLEPHVGYSAIGRDEIREDDKYKGLFFGTKLGNNGMVLRYGGIFEMAKLDNESPRNAYYSKNDISSWGGFVGLNIMMVSLDFNYFISSEMTGKEAKGPGSAGLANVEAISKDGTHWGIDLGYKTSIPFVRLNIYYRQSHYKKVELAGDTFTDDSFHTKLTRFGAGISLSL